MSAHTTGILEALRERGYRMTPQRRAIVDEIMRAKGHITAQYLAQRVQERLPGVNDTTVYRTLDLLEELGFLSHANLGSGPAYHRAEELDHVHLICAGCGRSHALSIEDTEPLRDLIARHNGFLPDFRQFAISGLCSRCQDANEPPKD